MQVRGAEKNWVIVYIVPLQDETVRFWIKGLWYPGYSLEEAKIWKWRKYDYWLWFIAHLLQRPTKYDPGGSCLRQTYYWLEKLKNASDL